jgi:hypothetical protein
VRGAFTRKRRTSFLLAVQPFSKEMAAQPIAAGSPTGGKAVFEYLMI